MSNALVVLENAASPARIAAARAAVCALMPGAENAEARRAAAAMLTVLAEDADLEVRLELARLLGPHPLAPRHVIMTLAADHVAVSALVLAQSPLLVDGELARMARDGEPEAQIAIACREPVSPALASAIGQNAGRDACLALITNPVAALAASALDAIAHRFGTDDEIRRGLLVQPMLSAKTRVLLIEKLGEKLAADAARDGASAAKAQSLARDCCDKALILLAADAGEHEIDEICQAIIDAGHMNAALLLRCVLVGSLELFCRAVARLSATPVSRVEALLGQGREAAFRALCVRAGLPRPACEVLWHSVCAWRLALADGHGDNATELVWRISQAALEAYRPDDDNDPVYILLRKVGAEAAREQARSDFHAALEPAKIEAGEDADATPVHPYGDGVIEVAPEIVAAFALHFAEEILDLEQSLAANTQSPIPAVFAEVGRAAFDPAQPDGEVAEFAAMLEAEIARAEIGQLPDFAPEFAPGDIANDDAAAVPEIRPDVAAAA